MAVQKLTPRYLNKDDDNRLIKSTEMTDALNVRISSDDDGDGLVLKNAYGNQEITLETALAAGTNRVIGSTANEQSGSIYYFVWNSNNNHSIYKYSVGSNKARLVYRDSVLAFGENGFVKGNVITSIDGDELLYFNTGTSEPKKINASKALRDTSYPGGTTDEEKLLFLTVAKQPPLDPPTYSIVNNASLSENRISDKVFQFAYRYVYADGEISAMSPYSSLTASIAQLRDGFNTQSAKDFYNQINVFVKNTIADVKKVQVYAREGNEGTFYQISEFNNSGNTGIKTINFTNSTVGEALSINDKNKLYDNVPQLADSQDIVSGRLMYGGYTEGYPNTDTDVSLIANYKDTEKIYNISFTALSGSATTTLTIVDGDLPPTFSEDSTIYINIKFFGDKVTVGGSLVSNRIEFGSLTQVKYVENDGTTASQFIKGTKDPVEFMSEGILISERIQVSSGSTKADALQLIRDRMSSSRYNLTLSPARDQFVDFNVGAGASDLFDKFVASVNGLAVIKPVVVSSTVLELDIESIRLYIGGVSQAKNQIFSASKEAELVNSAIVELDINDGDLLSYQFDQPQVTGYSFVSATSDSSSRSFKSGSSHSLGIVYYDDRNRSGGVQELGDVYVNSLNDRSSENDLYGPSSIVMRLPDNAPSWAKRWAPVYKGRGSSELKLMYSVDGAYFVNRGSSTIKGNSNTNKIYLSLNSIFGEEGGYNASTGADLQYSFTKGDRLRILSYDTDSKTTVEFAVLGFETLGNDDNNPILDNSSERGIQKTTGQFLVVGEDIGATGFTIKSIVNRDTNWNKQCVIEIYNSNREESELYYEVGKSYEVVNGVHSDERTATTFNATASAGLLTSATQVFKGDILETSGQPSLTILNAWKRSGTYYAYYRTGPTFVDGSYSFTVSNPEKVVDINLGDVYFRRRALYSSVANLRLVSGQNAYNPTTAVVKYIEDYSVSDFFASKSSSIGRPIAYIPDAKTVKRSGSITYSEPYLQEGTFNGLSSFNLSLANFKDLAYEHGSIKALVGYNERLYFIQENRSGVLAVNRNVIEAGSGDNLITLSKNVLQSEQYYVGEYGTSNPESVASRDGMVYFADVKRGKVLRIDGQGLTDISDVNMSSYFDDKFDIISKYSPTTVIGGVDKDNDEYIVSSDTITEATVSINTDQYVYTAQLDSSGTQVKADYEYSLDAVFSFNTEPRTFDAICDEFQDSVGAVVYLDELADGGVVYVGIPYEVGNLYGVATNRNYDFFVSINVNMFLPGFVFDNSYCTSDDVGSINPASSVLDAFTVAYGTDTRVWNTRYSFIPESIVSLHNDLYTFKSGKIYKHSEDANRNTYYGGAVGESIVEVVSNEAPSAIKTFESISLEGDTAWDAVVSTTTQSAVIDDTSFQKKEGFYYSYIHGDTTAYGSSITSVSSTSELFSLGVVGADVVSNNTITFSNVINTIAFPLGATATLYKINGNQLDTLGVYPLSVTGQKSLAVSGNISLSAGDVIVVVGNSAIEGDQIRDYFAKIKLTKTTSAPIELFAVNAVIADSKLHN